ncbi:hypothetical protein HDU97_003430 [Phlyctochytrium planicorne]|nr:hypothetical protein HDU97_003430 [Phlyctochytrium planicorne]
MIPLWPTFIGDLGWNAMGFVISYALKTEKMYDMFGTSSFVVSSVYTLIRLLQSSEKPVLHFRQVILFVNTITWAVRLGSFLVYRVHLLKGDRRFDKIKTNPIRFGIAWFIQAVWAGVVGLPVYLVLTLEKGEQPAFNSWDYFGMAVWTSGFLFDLEKLNWQKKEGEARFKKFLSTGLRRYCRYPNYFGEILVWTGNYLIAINAFPASIPTILTLSLSPLLTIGLLTGLSGIPLQEKEAKKRFEGNEEYKLYAANTSILIPWFPMKEEKKAGAVKKAGNVEKKKTK